MPLLRNGRTAGAVSRLQALDDSVDEWFERVRRPALDPLFYGLSSAADHGLLWLSDRRPSLSWQGDPGIALRLGVSMGWVGVTNGPVKLMFGASAPSTTPCPTSHSRTGCTARSPARFLPGTRRRRSPRQCC